MEGSNRSAWLALAMTVLMAAAVSAQDSGKITFRFRPPEVGQQCAGNRLLQYQFQTTLSQNGHVIRRKSNEMSQQRQARVQVLATDGEAATKITVHYDRVRRTLVDEDGQSRVQDEPLAGQTYTVERRDKQLLIASADGREVSPAERALLERYHHTLGHRPAFSRLLDGRSLAVGESIRLKADEVRELLGIRPEGVGQVDHFTLKLTGTRQVGNQLCGVFDVSASVELPDLSVTAPFHGEYVVTVDGLREASLDLSAPLKSTRRKQFDQDSFEFDGHGSLRMVYQAQPLRR